MDIRSAFLETKLKEEVITLPELGGVTVVIREMDAGRFDQYESLIYEADDTGKIIANTDDMSAKLVVCTLFDTDGNQIFTVDDVPELTRKNGKLIKLLAGKAAVLSGLFSPDTTEKN